MAGSKFTDLGMINTGQRFSLGVDNVNGYRARLEARMAELAHRWGGEASTTFQGVMAQWCEQQKRVIADLEFIAEQLGFGGKSVQTTESQQKQTAGNWFQGS